MPGGEASKNAGFIWFMKIWFYMVYPMINKQFASEAMAQSKSWIYLLKMVIFHSYVLLYIPGINVPALLALTDIICYNYNNGAITGS